MTKTIFTKTINSRDSLVVTHPTTDLPAHDLRTAERTGSPVFHALWSIAKSNIEGVVNIVEENGAYLDLSLGVF
jgi:hypothetical protein